MRKVLRNNYACGILLSMNMKQEKTYEAMVKPFEVAGYTSHTVDNSGALHITFNSVEKNYIDGERELHELTVKITKGGKYSLLNDDLINVVNR